MSIRLNVILAAIALVAGEARAADAVPAKRKKVKVAVMEIRALAMDAQKTDLLSEVALTEASSIAGIDTVGRSDIESMLGFEKQRRTLGCTEDTQCIAEVGGALGVDFVLVGSLGRIGAVYRLDLKLVDAQRGRVRSRFGESVEGSEEKLVTAVQRAVHRLLDPFSFEVGPVAGPIAVPPPAAATAPSSAPPAEGSGRRGWGYVLGGGGLAAVAGGVVFGVLAQSALASEKAASASGDVALYDSMRAQTKSRALIADVLYGVGAVGVGVGAYLVLSVPGGPPRPLAVTLSPIPSGAVAGVVGEF